MSNFSWMCPYCNHKCTIGSSNSLTDTTVFDLSNKYNNKVGLTSLIITCPNEECKEISIKSFLYKSANPDNRYQYAEPEFQTYIHQWTLLPASYAKPYPDYIPQAILTDYKEACAISDLSPKASATLARRCLQGMIRDYWNVVDKTLFKEINQLEEKVSYQVWEALNAIREIGNIGAHMQEDINIINVFLDVSLL